MRNVSYENLHIKNSNKTGKKFKKNLQCVVCEMQKVHCIVQRYKKHDKLEKKGEKTEEMFRSFPFDHVLALVVQKFTYICRS